MFTKLKVHKDSIRNKSNVKDQGFAFFTLNLNKEEPVLFNLHLLSQT